MRGLQQAVGLEKVTQTLGVGRFSLGSFSESVRVFDPGMEGSQARMPFP